MKLFASTARHESRESENSGDASYGSGPGDLVPAKGRRETLEKRPARADHGLSVVVKTLSAVCLQRIGSFHPRANVGFLVLPAERHAAVQSVAGTTIGVPKGGDMELTYETMKSFMEGYFRDYSARVNSADSINELDELYTTDFTSVVYMHIKGMKYPFAREGREEFKKSLLQGHFSIRENLFPNDIIIDERRKIAGVLLTSEKTITKTGEKHVFDGIGFYHLCTREDDKIKIDRLDIFTDDPDKMIKVYFQTMPSVSAKVMAAGEAST